MSVAAGIGDGGRSGARIAHMRRRSDSKQSHLAREFMDLVIDTTIFPLLVVGLLAVVFVFGVVGYVRGKRIHSCCEPSSTNTNRRQDDKASHTMEKGAS
jgi:hypothetical protein